MTGEKGRAPVGRPSIIVVLAAMACGGLAFAFATRSMAGEATWSCRVPARSSCAQWTNSPYDDGRDSSCRAMGGLVAHEPCPTDGAIGACEGAASARVVYYAPRVPGVERTACAQLAGTWR